MLIAVNYHIWLFLVQWDHFKVVWDIFFQMNFAYFNMLEKIQWSLRIGVSYIEKYAILLFDGKECVFLNLSITFSRYKKISMNCQYVKTRI